MASEAGETAAEAKEKEDRRNAIVTYREVAAITTTLARMEENLTAIRGELKTRGDLHTDHEIRLRALELAQARAGGGLSASNFILQAIWPAAGVVMAILAYLRP